MSSIILRFLAEHLAAKHAAGADVFTLPLEPVHAAWLQLQQGDELAQGGDGGLCFCHNAVGGLHKSN